MIRSRTPLLITAAGLLGVLVGLAVGVTLFRPAPRVVEQQLPAPPPPPSLEPVTYTHTSFSMLPGWGGDRVVDALPAISASCSVVGGKPSETSIGSGNVERSAAAWLRACAQLNGVSGNADLRERLEHLFVPFAVAALDQNGQPSSEGKFTGYYEASLEGSFTRQGPYQVPIYGVPQDLVRVDLRQFVPDLPSSVPRQIVGRVTGATAGSDLAPYFTRQEIDRQGVLNGKARVLLWAKDPAAVHILHIQGSGRVTLPDGRRVGVGFAGHNGLAFRGIGGVLLKAGVLRPGEGSMGHVRQWLRDHPKEAARHMDENARYIFFHLTAGETTAGPLGSQGVPLTPGRSLAVDPRFIPLGAMLWLDTRDPDGRPIQRLMVAQDTGAAIKGPVRGDLFWGRGEDAFAMAARMHSSGKYYILVPVQ